MIFQIIEMISLWAFYAGLMSAAFCIVAYYWGTFSRKPNNAVQYLILSGVTSIIFLITMIWAHGKTPEGIRKAEAQENARIAREASDAELRATLDAQHKIALVQEQNRRAKLTPAARLGEDISNAFPAYKLIHVRGGKVEVEMKLKSIWDSSVLSPEAGEVAFNIGKWLKTQTEKYPNQMLVVSIHAPVQDRYGNESIAFGLRLSWPLKELNKVNYKNFSRHSILNVALVNKIAPIAQRGVIDYCSTSYVDKGPGSYCRNVLRR